MKQVQAFLTITLTLSLIFAAYAALVWLYEHLGWLFQAAVIVVALTGIIYAMTLAMLWLIKEATKND